MDPEQIVISTEEFWEKMKSPAFLRLTYHQGLMMGKLFYVVTPPEEKDFPQKALGELKKIFSRGL